MDAHRLEAEEERKRREVRWRGEGESCESTKNDQPPSPCVCSSAALTATCRAAAFVVKGTLLARPGRHRCESMQRSEEESGKTVASQADRLLTASALLLLLRQLQPRDTRGGSDTHCSRSQRSEDATLAYDVATIRSQQAHTTTAATAASAASRRSSSFQLSAAAAAATTPCCSSSFSSPSSCLSSCLCHLLSSFSLPCPSSSPSSLFRFRRCCCCSRRFFFVRLGFELRQRIRRWSRSGRLRGYHHESDHQDQLQWSQSRADGRS